MRYLIYFLLLLNLIFWGWYVAPGKDSTQEQLSSGKNEQAADVETLVLMEERISAAKPDNPGALQKKADAPVEPAAVLPVGDDEITGDSAAAAAMMDDIGQSVLVQEPAPEVEAPLLEEEPVVEIVETAPRCYTLGPFAELESAKKIMPQLASEGLKVQPRSSDIREQIGYWVFLQTGSRTEAQDVVAVLKQEGITDYFVRRNNSISLGAFSRERVADAHRKRIAKLGFSPYLEPRFRSRKAHWLDLEEDGPEFQDEVFWENLKNTHPEAIQQPVECQ